MTSQRSRRSWPGVSPIADSLIEAYLARDPRAKNITAPAARDAYAQADLVIIATPTDYDDATHSFNTRSIESVLDLVAEVHAGATVIIKSTIPVGYTAEVSGRYPTLRILFSPEFLREGHALDDNLHPSRIIVGTTNEKDQLAAEKFAELLAEGAETKDVPIRVMGSTEAEAIKLFANTYLALRVSYFNELDTYAAAKGLNAKEIIEGVCLDPRIGSHYNNPSFGYGGYCLPKDSKQLLANYEQLPQNLMSAVVASNDTRKDFVTGEVLAKDPKVVGVYRLAMKSGSDNFRQSSSLGIIERLQKAGVGVVIFEPTISEKRAFGCEVVPELAGFKSRCDVILANRWNDELADVREKVYTRDLWQRD